MTEILAVQVSAAFLAVIIIQSAYLIIAWRREKKRRRLHCHLLAALETLRIIHFEGETAKGGKGLINKKLWADTKKVVALTSYINTSDIQTSAVKKGEIKR